LIKPSGLLKHWVNERANYIRHHLVYKKSDNKKEKILVVFDAAAKTTIKRTLNDILLSPPVCQNPLHIILINFRMKIIAVTRDIKQMYSQIKVHTDNQLYTGILLRDHRGTLAAYQFFGITFGLAPSAFLTTRTLIEIAKTFERERAAYSLKIASMLTIFCNCLQLKTKEKKL
jgi:hypothetical protein